MIEIVEEGDGGVFPTNELGWSCLINKVETRKVQAHPLIVAEIKHQPFAITILVLEAGPLSIFWQTVPPFKHARSSQCLARESSVEDGIEC